MSMLKIKKGDTVKVIAGKDKGKEGKVTVAIPSKGKVIVEGVAMVKKHQKARFSQMKNLAFGKYLFFGPNETMQEILSLKKASQ